MISFNLPNVQKYADLCPFPNQQAEPITLWCLVNIHIDLKIKCQRFTLDQIRNLCLFLTDNLVTAVFS